MGLLLIRPCGTCLIEVHVLGAFHCAAASVKAIWLTRFRLDVNVTSAVAHPRQPCDGSLMARARARIASMTYIWAMELADKGVRVNALVPALAREPE